MLALPGRGGRTGPNHPKSFVWVVAMGDHPNDHLRHPFVYLFATGEQVNEYLRGMHLPPRERQLCNVRSTINIST